MYFIVSYDYPFGRFKICSPDTLGSYFYELTHHLGPRRSFHSLGRELNLIDPDVTKIVSKTDNAIINVIINVILILQM